MSSVSDLVTDDYGRPVRAERLNEGILQRIVGINIDGMRVARPRQCYKVGINALDSDSADLPLIHIILNLLESSVFPDDDRYRQLQFSSRHQFGHGEHESAITYQYGYRRFRSGQARADGVRQRIT